VDEHAKEIMRRLKKYDTVHRIMRSILREDVLSERYEENVRKYLSEIFRTRPDRP